MRLLTFLLITLNCLLAYGENTSDIFSMGVYVINKPQSIPTESVIFLENRMKRAVAENGYGDDKATGRFALVAKCDVLEKDITPTTPTRISQKLEISFAVVDLIENKVYGSCGIDVAGIGTTETKAFQTAFQKVSAQNPKLKTMLSQAKDKILDFYTNSCSLIMTKAQTFATMGEYDKAIFSLMSVPEVCQDCYNDCHKLATDIYQQKIDDECTRILEQAQNKWAVSKTGATAVEVADIISTIDPRASNYSNVTSFRKSVTDKLAADEQYRRQRQMQREAEKAAEAQRQWEFKMKQYDDDVKFKNSMLDACRSVGEIFANKFEMPQINLF